MAATFPLKRCETTFGISIANGVCVAPSNRVVPIHVADEYIDNLINSSHNNTVALHTNTVAPHNPIQYNNNDNDNDNDKQQPLQSIAHFIQSFQIATRLSPGKKLTIDFNSFFSYDLDIDASANLYHDDIPSFFYPFKLHNPYLAHDIHGTIQFIDISPQHVLIRNAIHKDYSFIHLAAIIRHIEHICLFDNNLLSRSLIDYFNLVISHDYSNDFTGTPR
jgi:hypothetical protein